MDLDFWDFMVVKNLSNVIKELRLVKNGVLLKVLVRLRMSVQENLER